MSKEAFMSDTLFLSKPMTGSARGAVNSWSAEVIDVNKRQIELADVYQVSEHSINLNNRKVLIIDDIVTTGLTVNAIIKAILIAFPSAKISVFALAWTPTKNQQAYLLKMKNKIIHFNEPEPPYGNPGIIKDLDFEKGLTNVSLF